MDKAFDFAAWQWQPVVLFYSINEDSSRKAVEAINSKLKINVSEGNRSITGTKNRSKQVQISDESTFTGMFKNM